MKIVLVVERTKGQPAEELTFEKGVVRFGRDATQCDVAFGSGDYSMVSRSHAEMRVHEGKWIVRDLGSSYGTFAGGQKLSKPRELAVGNSIQFGPDGPKAHVIWMEAAKGESAPKKEEQASPRLSSAPVTGVPTPIPDERPSRSAPEESAPEPPLEKPSAPPSNAHLTFVDRQGEKPFKIAGASVWMGRDLKCDIVIEASAVMVSRRHAEISRRDGGFVITDNNSFNGTLVNEQRISTPTRLASGDTIRLGHGGPVLRIDVSGESSKAPSDAGAGRPFKAAPGISENISAGTMVFKMGDISQQAGGPVAESQLLMQAWFDEKTELTVGRNESCEITLDGLQISNRHAKLKKTDSGVVIEDVNSTNGVYVNGKRISRHVILPDDSVQIGAFVIRVDEAQTVGVFDTRSKTRIDSVGLTKDVKNRSGRGTVRLLDDVSLSIGANEFIGVLGPSGCGKSTLIDALNGMRPASEGSVYVNGLDLYRHLDSLKQSIGYVPQDDIIHRDLSVYKTLYYIGKLRLSGDVSRSEIDQIIDEVLDVTGLTERKDVAVGSLSGGQRKRVSIAVELITKPSVIFLDEPTSGLDPATEEKIMKLFRQIAESGRTVVLTTHAMENVKLFDKIVVLMRGKLVFYGKPSEALEYLGANSFKELYDRLEEPAEKAVAERGESARVAATDKAAEDWKTKFKGTPQYKKNIFEPLKEVEKGESSKFRKSRRLGVFGSIRQWMTLTSRYARVLAKDKFTLAILAAQAPIIAVLVFIVMGADQPRDFAYFALSLCSIWFGTSLAAREIVRERKIYERERMVNLGILPYVGSKLFVLGVIVSIQCLLLYLPLELFNLSGLMPMPGMFLGIPQFFAMLLTAAVGVAIGLFVSTIVRTSEMATSLVPLILIPQIVFSGLIGVPAGINKVVGLTMPAAWSFDTMKRFSTLDTLEPEGAIINGQTEGLGLYKWVEKQNDKMIEDTKKNIKDYEKDLEARLRDAEKRAGTGENVQFTGLPERPKTGEPTKVPEDLSGYITFLHPWMQPVLNQFVLIFMFTMLFLWTLIIMKLQDIV